MLPQFPLSKASTDAPTCLKDKLENMGRLQKAVSISRVRTVTPIENTGTYRDPLLRRDMYVCIYGSMYVYMHSTRPVSADSPW